MKKTAFILLFLAICTVSFAEDSMKIEIGNFKIAVPLGWMVQYTGSPYVFLLYSPLDENDAFQENANLTTEALPSKYTVKGYLDASIESIRTIYEDFKIIESKDNYMIISGIMNGINIQQIFFVYIKDKTAFILTFSSTPEDFSRFIGTFREIEKTFRY